jgi:NAD(P)-dependent dehydrogenase (short-subunit alcohol dehydrogenase family)
MKGLTSIEIGKAQCHCQIFRNIFGHIFRRISLPVCLCATQHFRGMVAEIVPCDDPTSLDWELQTVPMDPQSAPLAATGSDGRFHGQVLVITGAGGQLGREGCLYFAARGAKIVAVDLSHQTVRETFEAIRNAGVPDGAFDFKPYVCDVTDASAVDRVVDHVVTTTRFGKIDLLWNNAGYQGQIEPIIRMRPTDFANVMNINVTGMFIVLQAVAKRMIAQGSALDNDTAPSDHKINYAIVNTASVAGLRGTPAMAGYASSKAAVLALSVASAKELAIYNIRCNSISPALIGPGTLWERQNELHAQVGPPYFADTPDAVAQAKISQVPMRRLGTALEVVQSVAFLLSSDASYITGTNLVVDGGMSAGLKA